MARGALRGPSEGPPTKNANNFGLVPAILVVFLIGRPPDQGRSGAHSPCFMSVKQPLCALVFGWDQELASKWP